MYCFSCKRAVPVDVSNPGRKCPCSGALYLTPQDLLSSMYTKIVPQVREPQVQMASIIDEAIRDSVLSPKSSVIAIEAPTGTGKTLAYLAAALEKPDAYVVISVSTKNLQDQVSNDIGRLCADILRLTGSVPTNLSKTYALRGASNYFCRSKCATLVASGGLTEADATNLESINDSVYSDCSLSLAEITTANPHLTKYLRKCGVYGNKTCTKCEFRDECNFIDHKIKMCQQGSRIVVVNHAMVAAQIKLKSKARIDIEQRVPVTPVEISSMAFKTILSRSTTIIFDEAHQFVDYLESAFTDDVSLPTVLRNCGLIISKVLPGLAARSGSGMLADNTTKYISRLTSAVLELDIAFKNLLKDSRGGTHVITSGDFSALSQAALEALRFPETQPIGTHLGPLIDLRTYESLIEDVKSLRAMFDCGLNFSCINLTPKGEVTLTIKYHIPKAAIQNIVALKTVVLTSGTLVKERNDELHCNHILGPMGLQNGAFIHRVNTVFNYDKQCVFYIPRRNVIDPSNYRKGGSAQEKYLDEFIKHAAELIRITDGGTVILFSARREMDSVYDRLRDHESCTSREILIQSLRVNTGDLTKDFEEQSIDAYLAEDPGPILLGLNSFWEGFSVEGPALRSVIVAKLRFPRPQDPQLLYLKDRGVSDTFNQYSIPFATQHLRQAEGRLLRTQHDYGIVSLFDTRVSTKAYGRRILKHMSTCTESTKTHNLKEVATRYNELNAKHSEYWDEEYVKRRESE